MINLGHALPESPDKPHGLKRGLDLIDPTRPAPNFLVVGAAKAGTTSLHAYLSVHPQVFMPGLKEPHYFADFEVAPEFDNFMPIIRRLGDYHDLFKGSGDHIAVGEASPSYLCDPDAAERIKSAIPTAKIIISLRNPVDRAFSHYQMDYHRGTEKLPFVEALKRDETRPIRGWGQSAQYVELGLYADQVKAYLDQFGRDRVLVILFEDLVRDTKGTMQQVAQFLEIDPGAFPSSVFSAVHNASDVSSGKFSRALLRMKALRIFAKDWVPRRLRKAIRDKFLFTKLPKAQLEVEVRRRLAVRFVDDLTLLERLLGRDLSALRDAGPPHA